MNLEEVRERIVKLAIDNQGKTLIVNRYYLAQIFNVSDVNVRQIMAKIRHDKQFRFIPAGKKGLYVLYVKGVNDEAALSYVLNQIAHIRSSYFNNVVPFMDILNAYKDNKAYQHELEVVGQLAMIFKGEQQ